jgi:hypothetical protein
MLAPSSSQFDRNSPSAASDAGAARGSLRPRLEPKHFLPASFTPRASRCEAAFMNPLAAGDAFLTVAIMSIAFLIELGFFILIGMF